MVATAIAGSRGRLAQVDLILNMSGNDSNGCQLAAEFDWRPEKLSNYLCKLQAAKRDEAFLDPFGVFRGGCETVLIANHVAEEGKVHAAATHQPWHAEDLIEHISSSAGVAAHVVSEGFVV